MKILSDITPEQFVSTKLRSPSQKRMFLQASMDTKIGLVVNFIIGSETERYAPEPVYSKTGKGLLVSKGVEGIKEENDLIHQITVSNRLKTESLIHGVERLVRAELSK